MTVTAMAANCVMQALLPAACSVVLGLWVAAGPCGDGGQHRSCKVSEPAAGNALVCTSTEVLRMATKGDLSVVLLFFCVCWSCVWLNDWLRMLQVSIGSPSSCDVLS